jgi:molybdopterin molybdotransferase
MWYNKIMNINESDSCYIGEKLSSLEDTINKITSSKHLLDIGCATLPLLESKNRILADTVIAPISLPSFDNSAMDGFAINCEEAVFEKPGIKEFKIIGRIVAGETSELTLTPGTASRIFTGAKAPKGTNAIIKQEDCDVSGDILEIYSPIREDSNIRKEGSEISAGDNFLKEGTVIDFRVLTALTSLGVQSVSVKDKIKVGIFFTGNELINPGSPLKDSQIYNANEVAITTMLEDLGCIVKSHGIIKDNIEDTKKSLTTLSTECDLVITTGGASVGDEDYILRAIKDLGVVGQWKSRIKPGKPVIIGKINETTIVGLPGNTVSSVMTFILLVAPLIKKSYGIKDFLTPSIKKEIGFEWSYPRDRREFVRVSYDPSTDSLSLYENQNSNIFSSIVNSSGFAEMEENKVIKITTKVNYYDFRSIFK